MITRRGLFRRFAQAGAVAVVGVALPKQAEAMSPSAMNDSARRMYDLVFRRSKIEPITYCRTAQAELIKLVPGAPGFTFRGFQ